MPTCILCPTRLAVFLCVNKSKLRWICRRHKRHRLTMTSAIMRSTKKEPFGIPLYSRL